MFHGYFVAFALLCVLSSADTKPSKQMLYVLNGWRYGTGNTQYCPGASLASGFRIKYDDRQGVNGDQTGLNGIELRCLDPDTNNSPGSIQSNVGQYGSWSDNWASCPEGKYLKAFSLQVQQFQGIADDTSVNNIQFRCEALRGNPGGDVIVGIDGGDEGEFGGWSSDCKGREVICGIKTQIDIPVGPTHDKTALNNVNFYCC